MFISKIIEKQPPKKKNHHRMMTTKTLNPSNKTNFSLTNRKWSLTNLTYPDLRYRTSLKWPSLLHVQVWTQIQVWEHRYKYGRSSDVWSRTRRVSTFDLAISKLDHYWLFLSVYRFGFHDNAPIRTDKDVKIWILEKKIKMLPNWPAQSPDLNPIEHPDRRLSRNACL